MKQTYNIYEISEAYKMSASLIRLRAKKLGFKPTIGDKTKAYNLTQTQVFELINYKKAPLNIEVIKVTETYYIYQSKMNYENL